MNFFDKNAVLLPWPGILRKNGLNLPYKPREVWWKTWIKKLNIKDGQNLLEVGCGRGILLDRLRKEFDIKTYGIDIANLAIEDAKKDSVYKHELRAADARKLPFENIFFDIVVSFDTLEHVKDSRPAVSEMVRVLKPGGKILIYTINKKQSFTWDWFLSKFGVDVFTKVDHDPKFFLNPDSLKNEFENFGIKVEKISYFNAFFSLITDELIMIFLNLWKRFFGWKKTEKAGTIILKTLSIFSITAKPVLEFLDLPWTVFGHSNGFIIIGQKR